MKEFNKNDTVKLKIGNSLTIKEKLGEGGQGVVYRVELQGKEYALKWYTHEYSKKFYQNLDNNIKKGAPAKTFLWPLYITEWKDNRFGYVMELRPPEYKDFSHFLLAKQRFASLSSMINAALQISNAFRELHRAGYSYQDLNDGNFFINPQTGDVLICDNDNVAPDGTNLGIAGKCRYMAPEVVLGKRKPNADSDRFSLSVALFMLLFGNHPLEGKLIASVPCMTDKNERRFYGSDPVFIFDPQDDRNRPVMGIHTNAIRRWPLFPIFVREAFIHAFGKECAHHPNKRNPENEWQKLFIRLRDETVMCSCGNETFIDLSQSSSRCINCGKDLGKPLLLHVKNNRVVLFPQQKIYACHLRPDNQDFLTVAGEVIQNKKNPSLWGIRNLTSDVWLATLPDGRQLSVKTNEVIPVFKDIEIIFSGGTKAKIEE